MEGDDGDESYHSEPETSHEKHDEKPTKNKRKTEVDDKFFKLADMEDFLISEDAKEERRHANEVKKSKDRDDDSDEDDIDMFDALPDSDQEASLTLMAKVINTFIRI